MNTIKIARMFFGATVAEMAEALGVSEQQIGNWECGFRHPSGISAKKIGEFLGVDDAWILGCPQAISFADPNDRMAYSAYIMMSEEVTGIGTFYNLYITEKNCIVAAFLAHGEMYITANREKDHLLNSADAADFVWIDKKGKEAEMYCGYPCNSSSLDEDDDIATEILDMLGNMPLDWEYGQAVSDIYDKVKLIKEHRSNKKVKPAF